MYTTMADLKVVASSDTSVTLSVTGLKNAVSVVMRKYDNGAVAFIPWALRERLGSPDYEALKAVLRKAFGRVETRTATDPRFLRTAEARECEATPRSVREPVAVY